MIRHTLEDTALVVDDPSSEAGTKSVPLKKGTQVRPESYTLLSLLTVRVVSLSSMLLAWVSQSDEKELMLDPTI